MDSSKENKQVDHQTSRPRALIQGTSDQIHNQIQIQIILLRSYFAKTELSGEGSYAGALMLGKIEGTKRRG